MAVNETKMMQSMYDTLFNAYTKIPPGGMAAGSQEDKMFITMIPGGEPIDVSQYANPISPLNPQGTPAATENFSRLVDRLPLVKAAFVDSNIRVSAVYKAIVEGANPVPQPVNEALKAAYDKADDYLYDEANDFNDEGQPVKIPTDSPIYANYKRKQLVYGEAVATFVMESSKYDMTKPADQRTWGMIGPSLQRRLTSAWNDLQGAKAKKVEDALATLAQSSENQVGRVFAQAQDKLNVLTKGSTRDQMDDYLPSYAMPANWYSSSASEGWPKLTLSSASAEVNASSNYVKYGGSAGFSLGLFSVGGGASHSEERHHVDTEKDDLEVSFRYARISIERPWMNGLIFALPDWTYGQLKAGGISSGNPQTADGTLMTIVPTAFIVVRDLKISATWSKSNSDLIKKATSGGGRMSFGPFSIGGSYQSNSSDFKFKSEFDGRTITASGLQIMSFISTVLPLSPKASKS